MSHSQFHCTGRAYLDMHGLIFETSICYWQDQPGRRRGERRDRDARAGRAGTTRRRTGEDGRGQTPGTNPGRGVAWPADGEGRHGGNGDLGPPDDTPKPLAPTRRAGEGSPGERATTLPPETLWPSPAGAGTSRDRPRPGGDGDGAGKAVGGAEGRPSAPRGLRDTLRDTAPLRPPKAHARPPPTSARHLAVPRAAATHGGKNGARRSLPRARLPPGAPARDRVRIGSGRGRKAKRTPASRPGREQHTRGRQGEAREGTEEAGGRYAARDCRGARELGGRAPQGSAPHGRPSDADARRATGTDRTGPGGGDRETDRRTGEACAANGGPQRRARGAATATTAGEAAEAGPPEQRRQDRPGESERRGREKTDRRTERRRRAEREAEKSAHPRRPRAPATTRGRAGQAGEGGGPQRGGGARAEA